MTSPGKEAIFASESQKTRMETHQVAVMFGDGGGEIIEPKFACDAAHESERMKMTANERLEALAVGELQIQLAAVTFHQTEGVEFSCMPLIGKRVEVSPVDFEAFSGSRLHAHVGARGAGQCAHSVQVLFQNAQTTAEAERSEALCDHRGTGMRILLEELGDSGLEGIQFAGALTGSGGLRRRGDVLMTGDFFRSIGYPNIDRVNGGSLNGMVTGLATLSDLAGPNTKIIPGHGVVVDKTAVMAQRDMIVVMRDRVAKLIQQGKTSEEVLAAHVTSDYDAKVAPAADNGDKFADRFVGQLYAELKAAK